jgi:hypothetical protein
MTIGHRQTLPIYQDLPPCMLVVYNQQQRGPRFYLSDYLFGLEVLSR